MPEIIFSSQEIIGLSQILGNAMTGSEISNMLKKIHVEDNSGESTKWRRLDSIFTSEQERNRSGNVILRFIKETISPVAYVYDKKAFEEIRSQINQILAFKGLEYSQSGEFIRISKATTITEAQQRTRNLKQILLQRGVHYRVIQYCNEELLAENYFHSVLEATKSLFEYIREKTNLTEDGSALIDKAFSTKDPYLALNRLISESEKNEQIGFMFLLKGINSMVRNTTAHVPKIRWDINESDAVDILMTISFLHKILDNVILIPRN